MPCVPGGPARLPLGSGTLQMNAPAAVVVAEHSRTRFPLVPEI